VLIAEYHVLSVSAAAGLRSLLHLYVCTTDRSAVRNRRRRRRRLEQCGVCDLQVFHGTNASALGLGRGSNAHGSLLFLLREVSIQYNGAVPTDGRQPNLVL